MSKLSKRLTEYSGKHKVASTPEELDSFYDNHLKQGQIDSANVQAKAKQDYYDNLMHESDVLVQGKTFENFRTNEPWQKKKAAASLRFANNQLNFKCEKRAVIICGEYGAGKTHLAAAIINHITSKQTRTFKTFLAKQWSNILRKLWTGQKVYSKDQYIGLLARVDILLLDEVGAAEVELGENEAKQIGEILKIRSTNNKTTIITSNFSYDELARSMGQFAMNALMESGLIVIPIAKGQGRNQRPLPEIHGADESPIKEVPEEVNSGGYQNVLYQDN